MSETFTERQRRDLAHNWHPCTQMADHEEWPPLAVRSARGVWLEDETGRRILDGISSWWVNLFGHGHPRLVETLARQAERLDHCLFAGCTHDPAIELGERLAALSGLPRVFYADNGSCAVETALKMSFHAHRNAGAVGRTRFAHLGGSYHGETLGALGVGDLGLYGEVYRPLLRPGVRVEGPDCFRCPYGLTREGCGVPCLDRDRRTLEAHGESLCGVIVEPLVQGAAGMRVYPPAYLAGLRRVCSDLGIHLIDDEIAMGFGRTGTLFACQQAGVVPDLMCLSKGITGGMIPFSVVLASEEIYRAFYGGGGGRRSCTATATPAAPWAAPWPARCWTSSRRRGSWTGWPGWGGSCGSGWPRSCPGVPTWESTGRSGWWGPWSWWRTRGPVRPSPRTCAWDGASPGPPWTGGCCCGPWGRWCTSFPPTPSRRRTWRSWRRGPSGRCGRSWAPFRQKPRADRRRGGSGQNGVQPLQQVPPIPVHQADHLDVLQGVP